MHSLLPSVINPRILFPFPFRYNFSPFLNKCQLFIPKDFWNLPVNPVWRVPGFMKEGKADNEHSNPVLLPLVPEITNICISHLQLLHFQKFLLEVVAIGRKNAGQESDNHKLMWVRIVAGPGVIQLRESPPWTASIATAVVCVYTPWCLFTMTTEWGSEGVAEL
jgi:hypothetical protein